MCLVSLPHKRTAGSALRRSMIALLIEPTCACASRRCVVPPSAACYHRPLPCAAGTCCSVMPRYRACYQLTTLLVLVSSVHDYYDGVSARDRRSLQSTRSMIAAQPSARARDQRGARDQPVTNRPLILHHHLEEGTRGRISGCGGRSQESSAYCACVSRDLPPTSAASPYKGATQHQRVQRNALACAASLLAA